MRKLVPKIIWAILFLAALFIVVTSLVDRCSRDADVWAREFGDSVSVKLSQGD